jgi:hypothetical protein
VTGIDALAAIDAALDALRVIGNKRDEHDGGPS